MILCFNKPQRLQSCSKVRYRNTKSLQLLWISSDSRLQGYPHNSLSMKSRPTVTATCAWLILFFFAVEIGILTTSQARPIVETDASVKTNGSYVSVSYSSYGHLDMNPNSCTQPNPTHSCTWYQYTKLSTNQQHTFLHTHESKQCFPVCSQQVTQQPVFSYLLHCSH